MPDSYNSLEGGVKDTSTDSRGSFLKKTAAAAAGAAAVSGFPAFIRAAEVRTFSFGFDQPMDTVYGFTGTEFKNKIEELSKGAFKVNLYPGAQLGSETEMAQKVRTGDMDFAINSTANAAAVSPQSGIFSLEYLYPTNEVCVKSVGDPKTNDIFRKMIKETVSGAFSMGLMTWGLRHMYSKDPINSVADVKGKKFRVPATKTEDAFMTAYGAVPVHMPFGQVYTSLQTGVVQIAENGINVYNANKHYEVAPVLSLTGHEANNYNLLVSDKTWASLNKAQQGWVHSAFEHVQPIAPPHSLNDDKVALAKLKGLGIKVVENVDKESFIKIARPVIEEQVKLLGPYAQQLYERVRQLEK